MKTGGKIPLLRMTGLFQVSLNSWRTHMDMGSATAFMITGSATKITNLGAVKIVPE